MCLQAKRRQSQWSVTCDHWSITKFIWRGIINVGKLPSKFGTDRMRNDVVDVFTSKTTTDTRRRRRWHTTLTHQKSNGELPIRQLIMTRPIFALIDRSATVEHQTVIGYHCCFYLMIFYDLFIPPFNKRKSQVLPVFFFIWSANYNWIIIKQWNNFKGI